jgi:hypothetical protein
MITRRTLSKLALGSALAAPAGPASAFLHRSLSPEDWAVRLSDELNAALKPGCEGRFEVLWFDLREEPFTVMEAGVQLHWPPGVRGLSRLATGDDGEETVLKLTDAFLGYFDKAWTYPDGRSCVA